MPADARRPVPRSDWDRDGLTNAFEIHVLGTNPWHADTDRDGDTDWLESIDGSDPLDPGSRVS